MARKVIPQFADTEPDDDDTVEYHGAAESTVVTESTVTARVKGTWKMFWGNKSFDFKDGQRYRLPRDLFNYLKKNGNIYDTMA